MNITNILADLCSRYLDNQYSAHLHIALSTALAVYVYTRDEGEHNKKIVSRKIPVKRRPHYNNNKERFFQETEHVIKMIQDCSLSSDFNISFLSNCHELTLNHHQDLSVLGDILELSFEQEETSDSDHSSLTKHQHLWRLTDVTIQDIEDDLGGDDLEWQSGDQWHGVSGDHWNVVMDLSKQMSETLSDYGSLETTDSEDDSFNNNNLSDLVDADQTLLWDQELV